MSIYQDEKDMQYMPDSAVEAYKEGKGSKPDEQLLALLEQQKRLGLEADKQAEQNRPMPTVAQQVQQKAGLMDLQKMAQKLGMQITGMAPIGAPVMGAPMPAGPQPVMTPQGQPAPAGIAAAAPQMPGPAMPQAVAQGPAAPRPMAHGGLAAAAPSHMFKFAHGGGVLGFDGTQGSKVPETTPLADLAGGDLSSIEGLNVSDTQPVITSQGPRALPRGQATAFSGGPSIIDALVKAIGLENSQTGYNPRLGRSGNEQPQTQLQLTADKTPTPVPIPRSAAEQAEQDRLAALQAKPGSGSQVVNPAPLLTQLMPQTTPTPAAKPIAPGAGLGVLAGQKPSAQPPANIKPVPTPLNTNAIAPTEDEEFWKGAAKKAMLQPKVEDLVAESQKIDHLMGTDKPYGTEAEARANELRDQMKEWNKQHPWEHLSALLTGIVSGGYAGGAPAAAANEQEYRKNVMDQYDKINTMLSPVEQQRRKEALDKVKDIRGQMAESQKNAGDIAKDIYGRQVTGQEQIKNTMLAQAEETKRNDARIAAEKAMKVMEMNNPNREINATDIYRSMKAQIEAHAKDPSVKIDPALVGKSDYELQQMAIQAKSGQGQKLGMNELLGLYNRKVEMYKSELNNAAQMPEGALEARAREIQELETQIKAEQARLTGQPPPASTEKPALKYNPKTGKIE